MTMNPSSEKDEVGSKKELEEGDIDDEMRKSAAASNCKMMSSTSGAAAAASCSSSRQWTSSFKNPRIVRVSRSFGGKDRHSKVCTVRGLRDRRIRLSVPTAIQLYDLQDRLGLTQPSKVIDWLIDATKHEIDKLPPLPMLPTNFLHYFHQPSSILPTNTTTTSSSSPYNNYSTSHIHHLLSPHRDQRWNNINTTTSTASLLGSSHENHDHVDGEGGFGAGFVAQLSSSTAHNFFPLNSQFSVPNMMQPYNSNYFQLDDTTTPHLSLSQFGGGFSVHHQPQSNCTLSSSSTSSSSQQIYMCPPASSITPFAPYIINAENHDDDHEFRQINHYQNSVLMPTTLHLINSPIKSFTSLHSNPNDQT